MRSPADLLNELLDVAACALGGYEHLTGNAGTSAQALLDRLEFGNARMRLALQGSTSAAGSEVVEGL
jgi:hypothetical protein